MSAVASTTVIVERAHRTDVADSTHTTIAAGVRHETVIATDVGSLTLISSVSTTVVDSPGSYVTECHGGTHATVVDTGIGPRGPEGPAGVLTLTVEANCLSSDSVGDCVYVTGPSIAGIYQVSKADITDAAKMPAVGIITGKSSPTLCSVMLAGVLTIPGLTPGKLHFVSASGTLTAARPSPTSSNVLVQPMGKAIDSNRFALLPGNNVTRLIQ